MLVEIISNIWNNQIKDYYMSGSISTERNLQAELYHQMRVNRGLQNYQIWVEPTFYFENKDLAMNHKIPDLIITNQNKIESVIEIRYKPYGDVLYTDVIEKLFRLSILKGSHIIPLKTKPETGNWLTRPEEKYIFSENCIFIFAVVARDNYSIALEQSKWIIEIPKNFLHLKGKISESPKFEVENYQLENRD